MIEQVKSFDNLPAVLTVWPGLGEALGISRATAFKLVKDPDFPVVRIGKKRLVVPKDKLLSWLDDQAKK